MYIPNQYQMTDEAEKISFMKRFNFATIITSKENKPIATHLPFVIESGESVVLSAHFSKANEHWQLIESNESLIVFSEPHAYISPKHYEKEVTVPTWNYLSVHAYGRGKLISEETEVLEIMEKSIVSFESDYKAEWRKLPMDYKQKMLKGIVAFKIEVVELQGKKKISQNKTETEKNNIIQALEISENQNERLIAEYMKKTLNF